MSMEEDQEGASSSSWIARKAISLPNFCADSSGLCFKIDDEKSNDSFIQINSEYFQNDTHLMLRSPSPQIIISPPAIDRPMRYAPYLRSSAYSKAKFKEPHQLSSQSDSKFQFNAVKERLSSRLYKRRNAVSAYDLSFLRNAGRSMLMVPKENNLMIDWKSPNKLKKRVTFTNSNSGVRVDNEGSDEVFSNLSAITSSCIELSKQSGRGDGILSLANNFQDACYISTDNTSIVSTVSTETLCTQFSAMPIDETTTITTNPILSTSTSFACKNPFHVTCLNL